MSDRITDERDVFTLAAERIEELEARLKMVQELVSESSGVAGWHLNGNIATWSEVGMDEILYGEVPDND